MKPSPPPQEKKYSLAVKLEQLADMQIKMQKSKHQFENETRTSLTNQVAQLRNLEVQMGQMVPMFSERQQGNLPSTSEVNLRRNGKEHCKAITLRIGKQIEIDIHAHKNKGNAIEDNNKIDETLM